MSSIATAQHRTSGRRWPLYGSFAATGVALTLPGALLPMLLRRWSLGDARGGALLGSFFIGCTVGSICVRGRVARSMAAGAALLAFGSLGLVVAGAAAAYAAMTIYGMGLGLAMTSISLLVSQRFPADRRVEMQRLNLLWAVGAVCGPWLALHAARPGRLFVEIAVFFTLFAAWSWWMEDDSRPLHADMAATSQGSGRPPGWKLLRVPLPLLAMIFLATGVESSSAGWLTTYTERSGDSLRATIGTATLLWSGVLLSRGFHATRCASRLPERGVLAISAACISMALAILVASPERTSTMIAAAMLGIAAGPVYPLLLAMALRWKEDSGIFVVGGIGSAAIPLATGAISSMAHSLRSGLCVPLTAAAAMTVLAVRGSAWTGDVSIQPSSASAHAAPATSSSCPGDSHT
jgi:FHS family glucose/mannose:H+ symporter-like MFS transporter